MTIKVKTALWAVRERIPVAVHRAERALHLPYFGGVAFHYGPLDLVGGPALLLFIVGVAALFAPGGET
jgi:hypothetical protein